VSGKPPVRSRLFALVCDSTSPRGRCSLALAALVATACGGRPSGDAHAPTALDIDHALARAGSFLVRYQSPDGGFRSRTYAALRDGWSLSPLTTLALRMTPAPVVAYDRAARFVAALVDGDEVRGAPEVSYPFYAYAIGALVLGAPENAGRYRREREVLLAAVRRQQLAGSNGWTPADASFGGWGYAPRVPTRPAGEVRDDLLTANLSATVLAVGALALAGTPPDDASLVDAGAFVARCQNRDGGFFFSPALPDANKAGRTGDGYRSYGSMTADGLRALLRLGRTHGDPAVVAARRWLEQSFDPANNPGAFGPGDEVRQASSYYYWAWSAAHALTHAGVDPSRWAAPLARELLARQDLDGGWRNPATEMREDDPLVATSFAIAALALCRAAVTGERASHAYGTVPDQPLVGPDHSPGIGAETLRSPSTR
jgi:hypothetical protein